MLVFFCSKMQKLPRRRMYADRRINSVRLDDYRGIRQQAYVAEGEKIRRRYIQYRLNLVNCVRQRGK